MDFCRSVMDHGIKLLVRDGNMYALTARFTNHESVDEQFWKQTICKLCRQIVY